MSIEITIRDLAPSDIDTIVTIALAAWQPVYDSYRHIMGKEIFAAAYPHWRQQKAREIRNVCEPAAGAMVCVAERDGRAVGFAAAYVNKRTGMGHIGNNAVHPEYQTQGIATRMYTHLLNRLRASGMQVAKVYTGGDPSHAPARRAYEKVGFHVTVPSVAYYRKL